MSSTRPDINIHPSTRTISELSRYNWDVVILGGGPTGQTAAVRCAASKLSVLLVERELAGGECQNWACVPSKALLRPLEVASDAQAVGGTRERLEAISQDASPGLVDLKGLWAYRDRTTSSWNDTGNAVMLEELGVSVVHGAGSLQDSRKVLITDWHSKESAAVTSRYIVIATGSEPIAPTIEGLDKSNYWTPREAVSAHEVPYHLIILGAGPVGTEFATIYAKLGSRVTLVTRAARILPGMFDEAAKRVHQSFEQLGVEVKVNTEATKIFRDGEEIEVSFTDKSTVRGTEILVAAGRKTRTRGMGLVKFAVAEATPIAVDEHMRVKAIPEGWLYAIGDTNGIGNTTHMGMYEATICAQDIISSVGNRITPGTNAIPPQLVDCIPQTCFTDPQVSSVGMSVKQARKRGLNAREVAVETGGPGTHSYLHAEDYCGWAQWVIEVETGKLLGAVFVGKGVANLLHASTVAITGGLTWQQMLHAVPSFPTLSEAYNLLVQECVSTAW